MSIKVKLDTQSQLNSKEHLVLVGLNHKTAEISIREQLYFNEELCKKALECFTAISGVSEASILCTCNRTEVCLVSDLSLDVKAKVEEILCDLSGATNLNSSLYCYFDKQAVEHVFHVACGMDSLIPGEQQIAGQQKSSYLMAKQQGAVGIILNRLYQRAFGISKNVRSQTAIGRKAVSVSYAAKELSKQIFGDLSEITVMLIGAGATGELAAKYLRSAGVRRFIVVNRSVERALELARVLGAQAADLENFHNLLAQTDIIIGASSISAGDFLIHANDLKRELKKREGVAQFLIDLGLPRNFDPQIADLSDVFLYSLDDLEKVVSENINSRTMEFDRAKLLINDELISFCSWLDGLEKRENIKELVSYCEKLANQECEKTMSRLRKAGFAASQSSELKQAVDALASSLLAKIIHFPIKALRENKHEIEDVFKGLLDK